MEDSEIDTAYNGTRLSPGGSSSDVNGDSAYNNRVDQIQVV